MYLKPIFAESLGMAMVPFEMPGSILRSKAQYPAIDTPGQFDVLFGQQKSLFTGSRFGKIDGNRHQRRG
jgi:hypothetical protein